MQSILIDISRTWERLAIEVESGRSNPRSGPSLSSCWSGSITPPTHHHGRRVTAQPSYPRPSLVTTDGRRKPHAFVSRNGGRRGVSALSRLINLLRFYRRRLSVPDSGESRCRGSGSCVFLPWERL